jgi:antibiotic biosynthesis monooxygenase (ABM) superfamily enzyme
VTPDFESPPPPSVKVQAAALRAAFPGYIVNVIVPSRGDEPRYEVVRRDGGAGLYCLISTDAREIWRELRGGQDPGRATSAGA